MSDFQMVHRELSIGPLTPKVHWAGYAEALTHVTFRVHLAL